MKLVPASLRVRIIVLFSALLIVLQVLGYLLLNRASNEIAHDTLALELGVGERIFLRLLEQNRNRLEESASLLASDFAFRTAVGTGDIATVTSVLANHGARASAAVMMLISLDQMVVADTVRPEARGKPFGFPELTRSAESDGKASGVVLLNGKLYQLVVVPVLAPTAIAWVGVGFNIDDRTADDLKRLTALEVSFLSRNRSGGWQLHASTLPEAVRSGLPAVMPAPGQPGEVSEHGSATEIELAGTAYQARAVGIERQGDTQFTAVLQRTVAESLQPFRRVTAAFLSLAAASLALSVLGSVLIARNITRPLNELAALAGRVEQGDYTDRAATGQRGEIGALASSFNHMLDGILAREKENLRLAFEDHLTALPNRARFHERLRAALDASRSSRQPLAVLVLDLDRFKFVNDTLGHPVGDRVLSAVAARLASVLSPGDTVARLGGDEFAILLPAGDSAHAMTVATLVQKSLEAPIIVDEQPIDIGTSVGVAAYPQHADDADDLLRFADIAMYAAKRSKSGIAVYDPHYEQYREAHLTLLGELRRAIEQGELRLFYQPKFAIASDRVTGVEALVRWQHPVRGVLPPSEFIPFAEQTGNIRMITRWVIATAAAQCGAWRVAGIELAVAINVSARDLLDRDLVSVIDAALRRHAVPPALLCIELTESALMEDPGRARATLHALRDLGVRLAMDDYGTGYSSLAYIKDLALDEIKIDRAFVTAIDANSQNAAIVRSTIELGHSLGMMVIAEGVETEEELRHLQAFGCDYAQGYGISRPMPAEDIPRWMAARQRRTT